MIDLRLPVGIFFLITGAILTVYGLVHPQPVQGYNINFDWGILIFIFGLVMTVFGVIAQRRPPEPDAPPTDPPDAKP